MKQVIVLMMLTPVIWIWVSHNNLTRYRLRNLKKNDGSPVTTEIIEVKANEPFTKELDIRENDVFSPNMIKH